MKEKDVLLDLMKNAVTIASKHAKIMSVHVSNVSRSALRLGQNRTHQCPQPLVLCGGAGFISPLIDSVHSLLLALP